MENWKTIIAIAGGGMAMAALIVWVLFFKTPALNPSGNTTNIPFGTAGSNTTAVVTDTDGANGTLPIVPTGISAQKVFKVTDGPVAGATLIQTSRPTTTVARFIMQTTGHTFDLVLDSPGTVAKAISNTTIPGIAYVKWGPQGRTALAQYLDAGTVKTVYLGLRPAASTTTTPVRVQFLPSNIASIALSPDGTQVAYLLKTASGSDGYTARADGSEPEKLFSLPLSQVSIAWPTPSTLLAQSAPAAGVAGIAFSINASTGAAVPLIFAEGLSAIADRTMNRVVYQTSGATRGTYAHNVQTGRATPLSFDPLPEQCTWSNTASSTLYCAAPLAYVPPNYLDLWHTGVSSVANSLFAFDVALGRATLLATPGGEEGGEPTDALEVTVSPDDSYLLFIRKGDRSLWAVRLKDTQ